MSYRIPTGVVVRFSVTRDVAWVNGHRVDGEDLPAFARRYKRRRRMARKRRRGWA